MSLSFDNISGRPVSECSFNQNISYLMLTNNLEKMTYKLDLGLDANEKLNRNMHVINYCQSEEMLRLLLRHGLNLAINRPLLGVPMKLFWLMIEEYRLDPFEYCHKFTASHKIRYLNAILKNNRRKLTSKLEYTHLPIALVATVTDYTYIKDIASI